MHDHAQHRAFGRPGALFVFALGVGALAFTGPSVARAAEPDWAAAGREAAGTLSAYLQVDTTNPPGNELAGARFLEAALQREGIAVEIDEFDVGRANLIARLPSAGLEPPLCLMSHIDVVTAEAANWRHPPLSGHIDADGVVWGRGALDMKGMTAVELTAMVLLHRSGQALRRDVVLLAVADEELDNRGVLRAMERWDRIGCSHVINEGGVGIQDMFFAGQTVFPISVGEKGYVWGEIIATGEPAHGSTPQPGQAPERLVEAWQATRGWSPKPVWDPALLALLAAVGEEQGGVAGVILKHPALTKLLLRGKLMGNALTRAVLTDTLNVTGFRGAEAPNVVPGEVRANVDSRILPDTTVEQQAQRIEALFAGLSGVRFEVQSSTPGGRSPTDDPLYRALERHLLAEGPRLAVGPAISPGFTDSIHLRTIGVRAYGAVPFFLTEDELRGMHGNNERVSVVNLERGTRVLYRTLVELTVAAAEPTPSAAN
jgi:acetylornithine deacetylase/succinyl-diaminopimelate desuccinylase-like protein